MTPSLDFAEAPQTPRPVRQSRKGKEREVRQPPPPPAPVAGPSRRMRRQRPRPQAIRSKPSPTNHLEPSTSSSLSSSSSKNAFKGIGGKRVLAPNPGELVNGKFLLLWVREQGDHDSEYVWEKNTHFDELWSCLQGFGWKKEFLRKPVRTGQCNFRDSAGRQCEAHQEEHFWRHLASHLPKGVGWFSVCPACGKATTRGNDSVNVRHKCRRYANAPIPPAFNRDYTTNYFLR